MPKKDVLEYNELEMHLKTNYAEKPRESLGKIYMTCFNNGAIGVALFIDIDVHSGNHKGSCFSPIYDSNESYRQCRYNFKDIDGCIFIGESIVENAKTLENDKLFSKVKDRAIRIGHWREGSVALVYR